MMWAGLLVVLCATTVYLVERILRWQELKLDRGASEQSVEIQALWSEVNKLAGAVQKLEAKQFARDAERIGRGR